MAIDLYQPFFNKITGESFKLISFNEQAYITEWYVEPKGYVPFEHVHLEQDEIFQVLEGELSVLINGKQMFAKAGETLTVPRGQRHIASNAGTDILHCRLEYRPGLDMPQVFQCCAGLTITEDLTPNGLVNPLKMMYFMQKLQAKAVARPAYIPTRFFFGLMKISYILGELFGWEAELKQFTQA